MVYKKISLKEEYPALAEDASLTAICASYIEDFPGLRYPAMIICPGGGYDHIAEREKEPVAAALAAFGIQCFVLEYSIVPAHYPTQHTQLAAAAAYVRAHAAEYFVDPNAVGIIGFSAGAHLVGTYSAGLWRTEGFEKVLGVSAEALHPCAMGLVYGVLTTGEYSDQITVGNITGGNKALLQKLSIENIIGEHTPPAYICHGCSDAYVPVMNSLICARALTEHGICYEMHIHPEGPHGFALANRLTNDKPLHRAPASVGGWPREFAEWFLSITGYPLFGEKA